MLCIACSLFIVVIFCFNLKKSLYKKQSKKNKKYESYAARFAAKEALFKALGTGWTSSTAFNEVEIINDEHGKPEFIFYDFSFPHQPFVHHQFICCLLTIESTAI